MTLPVSTRSSPATPPATVPSLFTRMFIDTDGRDGENENSPVPPENTICVGNAVTLSEPPAATYVMELGLLNSAFGRPGRTPRRAAYNDAAVSRRSAPAEIDVRYLIALRPSVFRSAVRDTPSGTPRRRQATPVCVTTRQF